MRTKSSIARDVGVGVAAFVVTISSGNSLLQSRGVFEAPPVRAEIIDAATFHEAVETGKTTSRLVADLHAGTAPLNWQGSTQWSVLAGKLDDLSEAMKRLTRSADNLSSTLRQERNRLPQREAFERTEPTKTWLDWLREWFSTDSAG